MRSSQLAAPPPNRRHEAEGTRVILPFRDWAGMAHDERSARKPARHGDGGRFFADWHRESKLVSIDLRALLPRHFACTAHSRTPEECAARRTHLAPGMVNDECKCLSKQGLFGKSAIREGNWSGWGGIFLLSRESFCGPRKYACGDLTYQPLATEPL
jgi:hypothetical protein